MGPPLGIRILWNNVEILKIRIFDQKFQFFFVPKFIFFVIFVRKKPELSDFSNILKFVFSTKNSNFSSFFLSKISFICPKSEFLGHFCTKMRFFVWHFDEEWPRIWNFWTSVIGSNQECTLEWSGHVKSDF